MNKLGISPSTPPWSIFITLTPPTTTSPRLLPAVTQDRLNKSDDVDRNGTIYKTNTKTAEPDLKTSRRQRPAGGIWPEVKMCNVLITPRNTSNAVSLILAFIPSPQTPSRPPCSWLADGSPTTFASSREEIYIHRSPVNHTCNATFAGVTSPLKTEILYDAVTLRELLPRCPRNQNDLAYISEK